MHRRDFIGGLTAGAGALWLARRAAAVPGHLPDAHRAIPLVYVGTYTDAGRKEGVFAYRVDPGTGAWHRVGAFDVGPNPSFLTLSQSGHVLYAVNEVEQYEGAASGAVGAFTVDRATGALAPLGPKRATGGAAPCYVAYDNGAPSLLVANYAGGNVARLPLAADGSLGTPAALDRHAGTGPRADRQEHAHAHSIVPDPSGRWALSADLGADRLYVYALGTPGLAPAATPSVATRPGAGPRHIAFHPAGRFVFVLNELDLTLVTYRFDAATGALSPLGAVPAAAAAGSAERTGADVHVAPSGMFVYASVRGDDLLAVFAIDQATGALTLVQRIPTGGRWPRNFALDPAGRFLYAANQRSNDVTVFRVDADSGRLTATGTRIEVPAPVCVRFVL